MAGEYIALGVNIDHVATVRQARGAAEPDPSWAAALAELAGADQITVHLREDRRHIQDRDVEILKRAVRTRLNLEMGASEGIVKIALALKPDRVTLVPERRKELTTEGGLDVSAGMKKISSVNSRMKKAGIGVSLFISPGELQVRASAKSGADAVELHTGGYAGAKSEDARRRELAALAEAARLADGLGLEVYAGHGLTYWNVAEVCRIPEIIELNIGHSIVSRAVLVGMERAVREMKEIMLREAALRKRR
jgi:pyridoxine 5-phosphate synthase